MKRVIIESPYAGLVERNLRYLDACMADCLRRGESPYASHGLYTRAGVLDDNIPAERELGIQAGFAWRSVADMTVVYTDLGISRGMEFGIADADRKGRPVDVRRLGDGWDKDRAPPARSWWLEHYVRGLIARNPLPWHVEHDWSVEVHSAKGIVVSCMNASQAAEMLAIASDVDASDRAADLEIKKLLGEAGVE